MNEFTIQLAIEGVKLLQRSPRLIIWTWDTIKGFGATKALKTSYIFLFAVPMLARSLSSIPDTVTIPIWGKSFDIALALPFSWVVLFAAACFASLGNIIYAVMCPRLVKEFPDFPAFEAAKRDGTYLRTTVNSLALTAKNASMCHKLESVRVLYNQIPISLSRLEQSLDGETELYSSEFYFVRDAANLGRPLQRLIASFAYFAAFVCLAYIALQNVYYVIQYCSPPQASA